MVNAPMGVTKAFVLLSGGIDSTTCLYIAREEFEEVEAVSVNYGQRHSKEIDHAIRTCSILHVPHYTIELASIPKTMLTDAEESIPDKSYAELGHGVSPTYVPFRNGSLISALTSYAVGRREDFKKNNDLTAEWGLYFGAHAEDAQNWAYPDCTPEFIGAMANAVFIGTYREFRLYTPLMWLGKAEIIQRGESLGVDWRNTWSCYAGNTFHCGTCPTCRARREGFSLAGVPDPTRYEAIFHHRV